MQQASRRLEIPCIANRMSVITRPHNGRPACHYCGQCNRGCRVNANFSSPGVFIRPALETGKLIAAECARNEVEGVECIGELRADLPAWVQRRIRILKDHLDR